MKPLQVEFLRSPGPGKARWLLAGLVGLAAMATAVDAGWHYRQLQARRQELAQLAAGAAASALPASVPTKPGPIYERSARDMLAAAQSPWPKVLVALEATSVPGVKVNAVEISIAERVARIEVEALSYAALLQYLNELNAGEPAQLWVLQSAESQAGAQNGSGGMVVGRIRRSLLLSS